MKIYIYSLVDPRTSLPFYVGKTNKPKVRLKHHRSGRGTQPSSVFIRELRKDGIRPEMRILEICEESNWRVRESHWVDFYQREFGCAQILNAMRGGIQEGYYFTHSEATRERLRGLFSGRPILPDQRAQISKSLTGLKQSPETIAKRLETINVNRIAKGLEPQCRYANKEEKRLAHLVRSREYKERFRREKGQTIRGSEEHRKLISERTKQAMANLSKESRARMKEARSGRPAWNKDKKMEPFSKERRKLQSENMKTYLSTLTPEQKKSRMLKARKARIIL